MMTFEEFYSAYRKHDGEEPTKLPRKHDGYELRYQTGDTYVFDMELIPGRLPDWNGNHSADHYIYRSTWNGRPITH